MKVSNVKFRTYENQFHAYLLSSNKRCTPTPAGKVHNTKNNTSHKQSSTHYTINKQEQCYMIHHKKQVFKYHKSRPFTSPKST
jgi:hypothetical protein